MTAMAVCVIAPVLHTLMHGAIHTGLALFGIMLTVRCHDFGNAVNLVITKFDMKFDLFIRSQSF